jgi:hypothetical protein
MKKYQNITVGSIVTLNALKDAIHWKVLERDNFTIGIKTMRELHKPRRVTQYIDVACVAKVMYTPEKSL